jgi:hypothetical protein
VNLCGPHKFNGSSIKFVRKYKQIIDINHFSTINIIYIKDIIFATWVKGRTFFFFFFFDMSTQVGEEIQLVTSVLLGVISAIELLIGKKKRP